MQPTARRLLRPALLWLLLLGLGLAAVGTQHGRPQLRVVCSSIEDLCQEWAHDFASSHGVEVSMVRMSSGEALARIRRGGEFDLWHGGPTDYYEVARDEGLLQPYASPEAAAVPAPFKASDGAWTGVYRGLLGFCSNRQVLDRLGVAVPRTWQDLLDPRLAGQVSMPDPQTSGTGWTVLWTQRERTGSSSAALDYLVRLDRNVLQYPSSGTAPAGIAGRGEAAVAITFTQHCVKAHDEGMTDLVVSYPRGATGYEVGGVAVLAGTSQPDLARRYVDHAVGRRAQELGRATSSRQLPTRPDAVTDARLELPAGTQVVQGDPIRAAAQREELLRGFRDRVLR
ncbi:ABC transporter substrate-binding protein [Luteococcus peritonei]|uniref:ABC transporter substrate-binding protein n=1 Tax=Luteococcus peritonei TaxID=88874 RepID=A0ABW4RWE8_9ACTN